MQKLYVDSIKKYGINEQINENIEIKFIEAFNNVTIDKGFSQVHVDEIKDIQQRLLQQKFVGVSSNLTGYISYLKSSPQHHPQIIRDMNTIYSSYTDIEEIKKDLLKRIDIYSIGIIILNIINTYLYSELVEYHSLIIDLYNIVFLCCDQMRYTCANINDIILQYKAIVQEMNSSRSGRVSSHTKDR